MVGGAGTLRAVVHRRAALQQAGLGQRVEKTLFPHTDLTPSRVSADPHPPNRELGKSGVRSSGLILDLGCACQNSRMIKERERTRTARLQPLTLKPARSLGEHHLPPDRAARGLGGRVGAPPPRAELSGDVGRTSRWAEASTPQSKSWSGRGAFVQHRGRNLLWAINLLVRREAFSSHRSPACSGQTACWPRGWEAGPGLSSGSDPSPAVTSPAHVSLLTCHLPAVRGLLGSCVKGERVPLRRELRFPAGGAPGKSGVTLLPLVGLEDAGSIAPASPPQPQGPCRLPLSLGAATCFSLSAV